MSNYYFIKYDHHHYRKKCILSAAVLLKAKFEYDGDNTLPNT